MSHTFFSIHGSFSTTSPHHPPLPTANCPLVTAAFDGFTSALLHYHISLLQSPLSAPAHYSPITHSSVCQADRISKQIT